MRATNTGISGFVAIDGRVRETTPLFEAASVVSDVELVRSFSLYALLGDWLVYASLVLLGALAAHRRRAGSLLIRRTSRGILAR